ncbi:MAG: threonine/serine exporter ThrE family protein [Phycisphaerales bacterium JB052]
MVPTSGTQSPRPDEPRARFLIELARALGTFGTSANRVEDVIGFCADAFGYNAQTFTTPTSVFVSLEDTDGDIHTYLARVHPGEADLTKMMALDRVFNRTISGHLSPTEGVAEIKRIVTMAPRYPVWMIVICFGVIGVCAGNFLGGAEKEMAASGIVGLLIGLLVQFTGRKREFSRLMEFLSGLGAALIAGYLALPFGGYMTTVPIIAGIIILLPGLTLTMAMVELSMKHVVSGTARLAGAVMVLLVIGFGVVLGQTIVDRTTGTAPIAVAHNLPWYIDLLSVLVATLCMAVLFQAHLRHAWIMVLAGLLSFYSARFGTLYLGPEIGVLGAAMVVGVASNLYARIFDRPALVMMLPGLIILVPGSLGLRSLQLFMSSATVDGVQSSFTVLVVGVALVVGLLLANVIMPPRKVL